MHKILILGDLAPNQYYCYIQCRPNGTPFYVGKGIRLRYKTSHLDNPFYRNILDKYGFKNLYTIILPTIDECEAFQYEKELVYMLRTNGEVLANLTDGGEGAGGYRFTPLNLDKQRLGLQEYLRLGGRLGPPEGFKHLPESLDRIRQRTIRQHRERTPEQKAEVYSKISKSNTGKVPSIESRLKNRIWHLGTKQTEETKEKRAKKLRGKKRTLETRTVQSEKAKIRESRKYLLRQYYSTLEGSP